MSFLRRFSLNPTSANSQQAEVESVLWNLNHVLNTKRYYGSMVAEYGIDDLSHCTSRDALTKALIERITTCIELYEPRIELLEITPQPATASNRVALVLDCTLAGKNQAFDICFETSMSKIQVEAVE
ncbi:MAG: type VI secretion system baseplate subunit TssE [Myxococcota bacterium]|nr:type VI secretion system baseplate subunit TssE [Myxococcota bacterium]